MIKLLSTAGARISNFSGGRARKKVPLIEAARHGHLDAIQMLLELGADPLEEDEGGMNAVAMAMTLNHLRVVEILNGREWTGDDAQLIPLPA